VDESSPDRQLNIHIDPENMAGVYANFANISFSPFEFTLTFARVDHEVEEGDVPGVVVARVNVSHKFMRDLLDAMEDTYSKWTTTEGIRNLPEAPPRTEDSDS
jgi:hemerythrin-like domain-containing protein